MSNSVPDIGADRMLQVCNGVSTDCRKITSWEAVWLKGHIGVYIGGGKVIKVVMYRAGLSINGPIWEFSRIGAECRGD